MTEENYAKTFPRHPSILHYKLSRPTKDLPGFLKRYNEIYREEFPVRIMLDTYCTQDTKILAHALITYRENMKLVNPDIDVLR